LQNRFCLEDQARLEQGQRPAPVNAVARIGKPRCVSIPDNHRRLFDGGDDLQVAATMRVALRSL